jgi:diguanylate cyclase (GGDEF)-like protein
MAHEGLMTDRVTFVALDAVLGGMGLVLALALAIRQARAQLAAEDPEFPLRGNRGLTGRLVDAAGATVPAALGLLTAAAVVSGVAPPSPARDGLAAMAVAGAFIAFMVSIGPVGSRDPVNVAVFTIDVVAFGLVGWASESAVVVAALLVVAWVAALFTFSWRLGVPLAGLAFATFVAVVAGGIASAGRPVVPDAQYVAGVGGVLAVAIAASLELTRRRQRNLVSRLGVDPVTALPTRLQLELVFWRELTRSIRFGRPLSVLMIDLDGLKQVNDVLGHQQGDRMLAGVGRAIQGSIRASDFAARFGGDEFLVILPETGPPGAEVIANVVRRKVADVRIRSGSRETAASVSVGAASFPDDGSVAAELVAKADTRMYSEKGRRGTRR